jgi:hypothetical protein
LEGFSVINQEVLDIQSLLPVNKAVGPDEINHKLLKET